MAEQSATSRMAYGGQAVIEGVMIRGKEHVATACRVKDGTIVVRRDRADGLLQRHRWLRAPFLRGTPALIDSLRLGYGTLMWSADQALEAEEQPQKLAPWQATLTIAAAMAIGIGLFVLVPTALAHWVAPVSLRHAAGPGFWSQFIPTREAILPNIVEGLIRVVFLVLYILIIGRMADVKRVFSFHGAEHKVVNAYEFGAPLTVDGARPFSRIHPRCGTSFIFLVFVVGIIVHALIGWPDNAALRMASRLVLLLPIAGLSYELLRLAGSFRNSLLLRVLVWPGMLLQQLTTAEPEDDQIEVALASMRAVLEEEGVLPREPAEVTEATEIAGPPAPAADDAAVVE